jgi:hypothetical protein
MPEPVEGWQLLAALGRQALKMTRLGCHRFGSDQVRLIPGLIVCDPGKTKILAAKRVPESCRRESSKGAYSALRSCATAR